ncbi:MAG TPA: PhoH family protein, partial [Burkholderiaceae bacterium]|nr:PhoH family protein [Burkholderiaceae bacterium]
MILRHAFLPVDNARLAHLCGPLDEHLRSLETALAVRVTRHSEKFRIDGPAANARAALAFLERLYPRASRSLDAAEFQLALLPVMQALASPADDRPPAGPEEGEPIVLRTRRADLVGRTPNQVAYLRHILNHDITFGIGPAGTGKTFLAVACAVDALERNTVQRIVLTRPAVEAGERLGFLPGDLA